MTPDPTQSIGIRRHATEGFIALNLDVLKLNMNTAFGYGGGNHGDSRGPNFLGAGSSEPNILAAVGASGDTWGIELDIAYRLDTPEARAFLGQYVTLLP